MGGGDGWGGGEWWGENGDKCNEQLKKGKNNFHDYIIF